MEREVIAYKADYKKSSAVVVVLLPLLIICLVVLSVISFADDDDFGIVYGTTYLAFALVVLGVFILYCVQMFHTHAKCPNEVIVREGDVLIFIKDRFKAADIKDIQYQRARAGRWGFYYSSGQMKVFLNDGRVLKCWGIKDVEQVHGRLIGLIARSNTSVSEEKEEQNG